MMSTALGDWLVEVGNDVRSSGGMVDAMSFPGSFHFFFGRMRMVDLLEFLEMSLAVA